MQTLEECSKQNLLGLQVIVVMDPAAAGKPRLPVIRRSSEIKVPSREKRYVFDKAYDGNTDNRTLYNGTVKVPSPTASGIATSGKRLLYSLLAFVLDCAKFHAMHSGDYASGLL